MHTGAAKALERADAPPVAADRAEWMARAALLFLAAAISAITWAKWGSLIVDCGREMYIPAALSHGKRLYFDLWYPYGPIIPYWHALLFRVFGIHLQVLYIAGVSVATATALLVYSLSRLFVPVSLGFACGFTFIVVAFQLTLFNYVLPYSYPAAYGVLIVTAITWLLARDPLSGGRMRLFLAGILASAALLTKVEMGGAAYMILFWAVGVRGIARGSFRPVALDAMTCLPGLIAAAGIYGWLASRSSMEFMFGDNIPLLADSYFVKQFGRVWSAEVGFSTSPGILLKSAVEGLGGAAVLAVGLALCSRSRLTRTASLAVSGALCVLYTAARYESLVKGVTWPVVEKFSPQFLFFNEGMIWICAALFAGVAACVWRSRRISAKLGALSILAMASLTVGVRVLTRVRPTGYPAFYGVLPYVAWVVALYCLMGGPRFPAHLWRGLAVALCCCTVALNCENYPLHLRRFPVSGERGTIYTNNKTRNAFVQTLAFIENAKARSERFVIWPEEAALYFFSGTAAPSRWYDLAPGVLPPGTKTADYLAELEREDVQYVILSNRATPEYGTPIFGADYNQQVYAWLLENFEPVKDIGPYERSAAPDHWGVLIYKRKPIAKSRAASW